MCGILGLLLAEDVELRGAIAALAVDGLANLQHRGTESSGLVGSNGDDPHSFDIIKGKGLVRDVFTPENIEVFKDSVALIGHNRYSTAGKKSGINCVQPFVVYTAVGLIAIAHNGELVDAKQKRTEALQDGVGLSTDVDSELIAQMIAKAVALNYNCRKNEEPGDITKELAVTMSAINMSYSLVVMTHDRIYACRDPFGNRPLCLGTVYASTDSGASKALCYIAASESCAFPSTARFNCEVKPGEIVQITRQGIRSVCQVLFLFSVNLEKQMKPASPQAFCIFEYVYFARSDSFIEGQQVHAVRGECGRILAEESAVDADLVSVVPDSATAASIGYSQKSGIPFQQVFHRNAYVGRSFIQPSTALRQAAIVKKFGVLTSNVKVGKALDGKNWQGKRIVLVDDSIVRGNTMGIIVRLLREHGAKEVHLRIASPPVRYACYMGINIPSRQELIAAHLSVEEITKELGADSVHYLSVDGLVRAVQTNAQKVRNFEAGHCTACLTGKYPVPVDF